MKTVTIPGDRRHPGTVFLQIPEGWDVFIYRGFLYLRVDGEFRVVEELPT